MTVDKLAAAHETPVWSGAQFRHSSGPYGAYVISRYDRWDPASQQATFYYTLSNGSCIDDNSEPRYQVHLMKSTLQLVNIG